MKKVYFYLGIALAACLSSCKDDSLDNGVKNPVQTGDEILFGSTLSGDADTVEKTASTRTVYGDRTDTGVPVYWESDGSDTIAIFCLQTSQPANHLVNYKITPDPTDKATASSVTKVNTAEAGLQWGDPNAEHRFYAFYPARAVKGTAEENNSGKITANIPVTQQVQEWRIVQANEDGALQGKKTYFGLPNMDYAYMYAYNAVTPSQVADGQFIDLKFKNLVTVLDITVQGPESGNPIVVTNINVDAIEGEEPILTGDFTCNIRNASTEEGAIATCTPVGSFNEERGRISIPCYDRKNGEFVELGPGELLNVKAYIIPQDEDNTVTKQTLRISVATLNGAPCRKTLNTADVTPHKINRVILPELVSTGTNYWLSNLDPDIYFSELSIPGSFQSAGISAGGGADAYQGVDIQTQFNDGIRFFSFQTTDPGLWSTQLKLYYAGREQSTTLTDVATIIKNCVQNANDTNNPDNKNQNKNEFAVIEVWYKQTGLESQLLENAARKRWMQAVAQRVNDWATENEFVVNPSADMTIGDLANKVVVIIRYIDHDKYDSMSPYISGGTYNAVFLDWQDEKTYVQRIPVKFGNPEAAGSGLTINISDVTYVKTSSTGDGNITLDDKVILVKSLFDESVTNYPNETVSRTNWYLNNLGGFYNSSEGGTGGNTRTYATDMHNKVVDILQDRTQNAAIGIVMMNFADKQGESGAKYKSDWLIQTIIDNNFKFALRKKSSGVTPAPSYNASYQSGGNAVGWD